MTIVRIEERHLATLVEIERQCFTDPWSENALRAELVNPAALFLIAEESGQAVGYIGCHIVLDEGYITNVAIASAYRRKGIARALIAALRAYTASQALSFLTLEVRDSNVPAIALYEGAGFRQVGVRRDYYTQPIEDARLMTLYLT